MSINILEDNNAITCKKILSLQHFVGFFAFNFIMKTILYILFNYTRKIFLKLI